MERPLGTASRDRVFHNLITEYIKGTEKRHTPVTRVKATKTPTGGVKLVLHSSRPSFLRAESADIIERIKSEFQTDKEISIEVVAEARAVAKFVRTSPRKARLVLTQLRGKRVSDALAVLPFVAKIAAEPITKVLKSAAANAQEGWGANPDELRIATAIADGGPSLKRMRARAQGRGYRILKRTTHFTIVLVETPAPSPKRRLQGKPKAKPVVAPPQAKVAPVAPAAPIAEVETSTVIEQVTEATPVTVSDAPEEQSGVETMIEGQGEAEPNQE
jgi:large subunit ribosomal protein L22